MQMNFMLEFFPITKTNRNNKEVSYKAGYFTTQWNDTTQKIAAIKPIDNKIYTYIDTSSVEHENGCKTSIKYWQNVFNEGETGITLEILSDPFGDEVFRYLNSITITDNVSDYYGVAGCVLDGYNGNIILSNASFCSLNHELKGNSTPYNYIAEMNYTMIEEDHEKLEEYNLKGKDREATINNLVEYNKVNTIVHEIGHCFGLRHNFAGTTTIDGISSNTVMDYIFLDNGKYTVLRDSEWNKIGLYDKYAIQYGYGNLTDIEINQKKDIIYVSDYNTWFFPFIGEYDNENTIDKSGADKFSEMCEYWTDMYQNIDLENSKKIGIFKTKEEYLQIKYLLALNYKEYYIDNTLFYVFLGMVFDINENKVKVMSVEDQIKICDILIKILLNRNTLTVEKKKILTNLSPLSEVIDTDGVFITNLVHDREARDYLWYATLIIIFNWSGLGGIDYYDTMIGYYENTSDEQNMALKVVYRMHFIAFIASVYSGRRQFVSNQFDTLLDSSFDTESEEWNLFNENISSSFPDWRDKLSETFYDSYLTPKPKPNFFIRMLKFFQKRKIWISIIVPIVVIILIFKR